MTTKQKNKLVMYVAVKAVCDAAQSIWTTLQAFADAYTDFTSHISNIQSLAQNQMLDTKGITKQKQQAKLAMSKSALGIANAVHSYAVKINNSDLAAKTDFVLTDLTKARDLTAAEHCQNIYDLANASLASLDDYGVTAAKMTALQTAIAAFNTAMSKTKQTTAGSKTFTGNLPTEFKAADINLEDQLDRLVDQFAAANAKFVSDYKNARVIIDLGGGHDDTPPPAPPTPS
ncbi:MAG: hypothetical protein WDM76_02275 [Limisphaerales bacterium]